VDWELVSTSFLIFAARVIDVSLGTLRASSVVQGRKYAAAAYGFFEVLLWITVVSKVVTHLTSPYYYIAFALGFATGQLVGMSIEQWLGHGARVIRIFTRKGKELSSALRETGMAVSSFQGEGRDGPVEMLFIETRRRNVRNVMRIAQDIDPKNFFLIDTANVVRKRP